MVEVLLMWCSSLALELASLFMVEKLEMSDHCCTGPARPKSLHALNEALWGARFGELGLGSRLNDISTPPRPCPRVGAAMRQSGYTKDGQEEVSATEAVLLCSLRVDPEAPPAAGAAGEALTLSSGCGMKRGWRRIPGTNRAVPLPRIRVPRLDLVAVHRAALAAGATEGATCIYNQGAVSSGEHDDDSDHGLSEREVSLAASVREAATFRYPLPQAPPTLSQPKPPLASGTDTRGMNPFQRRRQLALSALSGRSATESGVNDPTEPNQNEMGLKPAPVPALKEGVQPQLKANQTGSASNEIRTALMAEKPYSFLKRADAGMLAANSKTRVLALHDLDMLVEDEIWYV